MERLSAAFAPQAPSSSPLGAVEQDPETICHCRLQEQSLLKPKALSLLLDDDCPGNIQEWRTILQSAAVPGQGRSHSIDTPIEREKTKRKPQRKSKSG
jgi:hypothetical protein